jgi:5-methylcytosine-specific restriction enzyme A
MPQRPPHPCRACPTLTSGTYCPEHEHFEEEQRRRADHARGSATDRLYDGKWRRYAATFVKKNPLCFYCGLMNRTTATECVDHAVPHRGDVRLFWDKANHRSACITCNSRKGNKTEEQFRAQLAREYVPTHRRSA